MRWPIKSLSQKIMTWFLVGENRNLYHYMISASLFGLAVLIRGSAIYLLPGMIFVSIILAHPHHKRFAVNIWITFVVCVISLFPLYAQMRQELFPEGWLLGGDFPHVSLIERISDRGPSTGVFLNLGSGLRNSFVEWTDLGNLTADPVIVFGGIISLIVLALLSRYNKLYSALVFLVASYVLGLFIGGRVVTSDVLILLPFFAIAAGVCIAVISDAAGVGGAMTKFALTGIAALIMLYPFYIFYTARVHIYTMNQVSGQINAVSWIQQNIPDDSMVITDNYSFVALRQDMTNVHHYWKVDTDPDIKFTLLEDNHCNIDYVLTTPQVTADVQSYNLDLMRRTIEQSQMLRTYENEGWPVQIWQVNKQNCEIVDEPVPAPAQPNAQEAVPQSPSTSDNEPDANATPVQL